MMSLESSNKRIKRAYSESSTKVWGRVLSIQSHVVYGHVGNKSAVFPLQLLGFDVDPINSVQFSNHTGYKNGFKGDVLNGDQLTNIVQGMKSNGLLSSYTHMLTGYIGSVSFLQNVINVYETVKAECPGLTYFCDPVLGDKGKLYVTEELIGVYRSQVVPIATVLTPNQFELELLSEIKVTNLDTAKQACNVLHERGVQVIILTSSEFEDQPDDSLILLASIRRDKTKDATLIKATQPKVEGHYVGTGDLIAALLLAWMHREQDMETAILKACTSMHAVVSRTREAIDAGGNPHKELFLIQSRKEIEEPDLETTPIKVQTL